MYINKADSDKKVRDSIVNTAILLRQCAVTCSCGAPAPPIQQKGNKYQCIISVFVNIVVTQFNIKRLKPHWH